MYREDNVDMSKNERKHLDLSTLPSNNYVIQIRSANFTGQKKIIIVK